MNENVKTGLLAFVAVLTVLNTYLLLQDDGPKYRDSRRSTAAIEASQPQNINQGEVSTDLNLNDFPDARKLEEAPAPAGPPTVMKFAETSHDFGTIKQNTENKKLFTFTNAGDEPLIIQSAKGSCGCTVPKYPKEPIAPGATGEIEVVYSPGQQKGTQRKTVTIVANTNPPSTVLTIGAEVEEEG